MNFFRKVPKRTDDNYITPWKKYKNLVNDLTIPATNFVCGQVYSLGYNFSKEYNMDDLIWYDYMPLIYVHHIDTDKGYFTAINLHHYPVIFRERWLQAIITGKKLSVPTIVQTFLPFLKVQIPDHLKKFSYDRQENLMPWIKYAVRNYRFDRVLQARSVTPQTTEILLKLYADTFYGATGTEKVRHFYADVYKKEKKKNK